MILADGATPAAFRELFAQGELPSIQRYLSSVSGEQKVITAYPSVTGPTFAPMLTGCFPGTCNLPGVRWFDRHLPPSPRHAHKRFRNYFGKGVYLMDNDLSPSVRTLFELVPDSYNILSVLNRGTGIRRDLGFFWAPYLFLQSRMKDGLQKMEQGIFRLFMKALEKDPQFLFFYFPSIDAVTHQYGSNHPEVKAAYRRLDALFEAMVGMLMHHGLWEDTLTLLTSDHGMSDVHGYLDTDRLVERLGLKTCYLPKKLRGWKDADAISLPSGNAMVNLYLRHRGQSWHRYFYYEEIEVDRPGFLDALIGRPEVLLVAGRSLHGGVCVCTKKGRARIVGEKSPLDVSGDMTYEVQGSDPFGYADFPVRFNEAVCYQKTQGTDFPDAPVELLQFFRSSRAGDVLIAAEKGYEVRHRDLEKPIHIGTHGSFFPEHMWIPVFANRPLPALRRSVDLFQIAAKHLGVNYSHAVDF